MFGWWSSSIFPTTSQLNKVAHFGDVFPWHMDRSAPVMHRGDAFLHFACAGDRRSDELGGFTRWSLGKCLRRFSWCHGKICGLYMFIPYMRYWPSDKPYLTCTLHDELVPKCPRVCGGHSRKDLGIGHTIHTTVKSVGPSGQKCSPMPLNTHLADLPCSVFSIQSFGDPYIICRLWRVSLKHWPDSTWGTRAKWPRIETSQKVIWKHTCEVLKMCICILHIYI
jgi:hypothetical protein